ncbi:MAG: hypothetical protein P8O15_03255, partial [Luminiphilus sp.]|nr:hypothetical protein [Luminiphilus sp.]
FRTQRSGRVRCGVGCPGWQLAHWTECRLTLVRCHSHSANLDKLLIAITPELSATVSRSWIIN